MFLEGRLTNRRQGIVYGDIRTGGVGSADVGVALQNPAQVIAVGAGGRWQVTTEERWGDYLLVLPPGDFEIWVERNGSPVGERQKIAVRDGRDLRVAFVIGKTQR